MSGSKSPLAVLLLGLGAIGLLGYLSMYFIDDNPAVQKLLEVRDQVKNTFHLPVAKISYHRQGRATGTLLVYRSSPNLSKESPRERAIKMAAVIFSYERRVGRLVWKMPQSFVVVQELKEGSEGEVLHSHTITAQVVGVYNQGELFKRDFQKFLHQKYPSSSLLSLRYAPEGWMGKGRILVPFQKGKTEEDLRKEVRQSLTFIRKYHRSFTSHLREFVLEGSFVAKGKDVPGFEITTTYRPGVIKLPGSKGGGDR